MKVNIKCQYCGGKVILIASRLAMCSNGKYGCIAPIWGVWIDKKKEKEK